MGKRWGRFVALLVIAIAVSSCFASLASAEGEEDTGGFGAFRLQGTNGFSILVMALSRPHFRHGEVLVWATKRNASVIYVAPASVTDTSIDADLGAVGELSVAFEPSGPPESVDTSCEQAGPVPYEPGAWVGTIDIEGEEGFTRVQRSRAKAIVSPFIEALCGSSASGETMGHGIRGARLFARSATKKHALYLQANKNHRNATVRLEASLEERRGKMFVTRAVTDHYPAASFSFDPLLRTATLAPPAPFSGSATFHRLAKPANRWTGRLAIDFPGRADVSLAGNRFDTTLVHAKREEKTAG